MSENYDKERVLEDAGAVENVGEGFPNGFLHVESSFDTSQVTSVAEGAAGSADEGTISVITEPVDAADTPDSVHQESSTLQVERVDQNNGVLGTTADFIQDDPDDVKVTDDGGKEDMFVDCPEELAINDGRNSNNRETMEIPETQQRSEEKDDIQEIHSHELNNGRQVQDLMDELNHLRAMLEKTVDEKESFARKYEEEREAFKKEVVNLHHQLKALNEQQSLTTKNDVESVDCLYEAEIGEGEEKSPVSDTPLDEMINECFKFLKNALDERLQTEGTFRELQAIQCMKNQEIEDLHAKVAELSVSQDVVVSFLNSSQESWSQSLKASSGVQLEKDQHIEAIASRVLASLATAVSQEELLDESVAGKISYVEKSSSLLIEKYNQFLSEMDLLRQCLTKGCSDLSVEDEFQTIFFAARDELLEFRRKEVDLAQKISHLEDENAKLVEQLDKYKEMAEMANAEIGKLKVELEQEKRKYANTKEKLSLAVTKGKALVQQRDTLKRSLAEKTSELEKCLIELQEKSSALQAAELSKEELVKSENLAASFKEALSQRDSILQECEAILSQTGAPDELQSTNIIEIIRWLVDERNVLKGVSLEFQNLTGVLSLIDSPENVSCSNLESRVGWLVESLSQAQVEANKLKDEIAITKEAAHNDIDRLTTSLLAEIQEKNYLREELEDLMHKYEGIVEKEHQVSLEKDRMVSMLLEASGITLDSQEEVYQPPSDVTTLIDRCFGRLKEQSSAVSESSLVQIEMFERIQKLLYIRDQELMLYEKILEEEMMDRLEVNNILNELRVVSQELQALKDEKSSLQKDFERAEEKSALLREKLSMAVKKGKGLVQERENLKRLLDEKNAEIEKLKLELQQQESAFSDCREQFNKLSTDVECIPKLEADLVAIKNQRDQLEQFLVESNNMLQRVIEFIDGIALPVDSIFEDPVEKVKWLAGYVNECQDSMTRAELKLEKGELEINTLASKLAEAYKGSKSLEDALSIAENNISQLAEEKRELEVGKTYAEQELQKAMEEASFQAGKFTEVCATRKSLEDALSLAENNISMLINEKEDAQISRVDAESELEKVKEEVSVQTSKLAEAYRTIKSLEDALSEVETNVSLLAQVNNNTLVGRTNLENEIKNLKEEADSGASKLADACSTIKRLEDALLKSEENISELIAEKKNAEQEISTINSKLNACMQELAGTHGNIESRSLELSGHLNSLQLFLKDETLLSLLRQNFERNFERLKNMDLLLKDIKDHFVEMGSETLRNHPFAEESYLSKLESAGFDSIWNIDMDNGDINAADCDNIASYFRKTVEGFHLRNKILADKVEGFSTSMDEFIAALLTKLQATRNEVIDMLESMKSLKQKVNSMEMNRQEQENTIAMLENDITVLLSSCSDATQELEIEVENKLLELSSDPGLEKSNHSLFSDWREVGGDAVAEHQQRIDSSKYVKTAEKLLFTARRVRALTKQFENIRNLSAATIEDLQNKLKEARRTLEDAKDERDLNQNRVSELESDVEALQSLCNEMRFKLEDYQAKECKLKEREAECSSLYNTSMMKEKEAEDPLLSASQVKFLFDKINGIEIPFAESKVGDSELHDSTHVKKLFYIVDNVAAMHYQVNLLSRDKEELQSTLAKQVIEIEHLKEEVEQCSRNKQDYERMQSELFELALGLENIIQKLGGNDLVGDQKSASVKGLLQVLEKLVMAIILESENSKSKAQELGAKLLGSQTMVGELSAKVKLLEDNQSRAASPETVQERSIFETPSLPNQSEISEIEDVGPLGKKVISPAPSAAHVRTLRKGSSDHLALNIDLESDRLINNEETDEDKGHVFKSLNTSGLVPRQGKMIADRIDGIWVSGGRALMSRPRARLGLIAYWLFLHIWLLGTIL